MGNQKPNDSLMLVHNQYNTDFYKLDVFDWQEELGKLGSSEAEFYLLSNNNDDNDLNDHMLANCVEMVPDSINNKSFTDVTFIVGPPQHSKKYVGHRVLLAMTSPVFETMFYGDMADKNKYIRIPDVAPIGFENLLRYAYTDSLNLSSVEDAMLTAYAAKKYLLPQLLRECLTYIEHNISPSTACVVFEFAQVLNSQQLVLQAMNLIDRQTLSVITNKSFARVQASTIEFVANRKYLNLQTEYLLFTALVHWSQHEAKRRELNQDDWSTIRSIMTEYTVLGSVRFLAMTQEEFARVIAKTSSLLEIPSSQQQETTSKVSRGGEENGLAEDQVAVGEQQPVGCNDMDNEITHRKVDVDDSNCLLTDSEQRAIFLNLALANIATLPPTINQTVEKRQPPPDYFTLRRFKTSSGNNQLVNSTTTTRNIKSIVSKFQCLSENVFIVGLTIPIRLDASSAYATRTPKFECHLKFTTKSTATTSHHHHQQQPASGSPTNNNNSSQQHESGALVEGSTLLMDTIDESLHISIARDKDCLVRFKRPILVRMGNLNELVLTFQTYALDEDIVVLKAPKLRSSNFSEQTDGENISWLFFKTSNIEFSELHYYY